MWKTFIDLESDADTLDLTDAAVCHAGALRSAVVEMLRLCSTLKLCHAGVWRTILVLVLRMVLGIKIWTECAAFAVSLAVHAILSSPRHGSSQTAAIRQQEHTQKRTLFSVSTYLNQALLFVFISFLVLSPLWLLGVLLLKGMMMMEL